jgi:hypothetical protein
MDREKVKEIVGVTGCDERLAWVIAEFTDGDVDKAKKIILGIPKDIIVLTVRWSANQTQRFGVVLFIYNGQLRIVEDVLVAVSRNRAVTDLALDAPLQAVRQTLDGFAKLNPPEEQDAAEVLAQFRRPETVRELNELVAAEPFEEARITQYLTDLFFKVFTDPRLTVRFDIRRIDSFQLHRGEKELGQPGRETAEGQPEAAPREEPRDDRRPEFRNDSLIILQSAPFIEPVNGTAIPKFKPGDTIYADISDKREIGAYLRKLILDELKASGVTETRIPAVIEELEYSTGTDNVNLIIRFGPGIYGRIVVTRDLKIDAPRSRPKPVEETPRNSYTWLVWIFLLSFLLVIVLMLFLKK